MATGQALLSEGSHKHSSSTHFFKQESSTNGGGQHQRDHNAEEIKEGGIWIPQYKALR